MGGGGTAAQGGGLVDLAVCGAWRGPSVGNPEGEHLDIFLGLAQCPREDTFCPLPGVEAWFSVLAAGREGDLLCVAPPTCWLSLRRG